MGGGYIAFSAVTYSAVQTYPEDSNSNFLQLVWKLESVLS